jgi:hypothetical protein
MTKYLDVDERIGIEMDTRCLVMRVYGLVQPGAAYGRES